MKTHFNSAMSQWRGGVIISFLLLGAGIALAVGSSQSTSKTESFDRDPRWEAHNNRVVPDRYPTFTQDFGYSKTNFAGKSPGEMGGVITRAAEPAFYADKIGS